MVAALMANTSGMPYAATSTPASVLLLAIVVAVKRLHLRPRPALAAFAGIVWIGSFAASLYYSEGVLPAAWSFVRD